MATDTPTAITAREYLRVSKDKSGRMRSPAETHEDNAAHAEREGWTLGEPYQEPRDVGASRYSTGARVGFDALVADLEAGRFGAQILIMWSSSRGSRRLSEWAKFLELLLDNGVQPYITSHSRLYDLANWRDMRTMQEDGVDNEAEIAKLRAGVLRAIASDAANGQPHSTVNVGYRVVRDPRTGKRTGWEIDPDKALLIEELFKRVRAGDSFRSISRDWEARGIVNGSGRPYSPEHLRILVTRPAYTGLRVHKGTTTEATWPPIIPRADWYEVQRLLAKPKQHAAPRPGRAVHTYSMIIKCDECGGPLIVQASKKTHKKKNGKRYARRTEGWDYRCRRGHVSIVKGEVDRLLDAAVVAYLARPDNFDAFAAMPERSAQVDLLETRLAETRLELAQAEAEEPETVHEAKALGRLIENLTRRITDDEQELRALTTPPELAQFLKPGEEAAREWRSALVPARRRAAAVLLSPAFLGAVTVSRSAYWRQPADERLKWRQETGEA